MPEYLTITLPKGVSCLTEEIVFEAIKPFCTNQEELLNQPVSLIVPEGVTELRDRAFKNILNLQDISLPSTLRTIGNAVFYNSELRQITIPEGVVSIGDAAFACSFNLHTVHLPQSLIYIGAQAFYRCDALAEIDLPHGLRSMGGYAFSYCAELRWLELPADLSQISVSAFHRCPDLLLYLADGRRISADSFCTVKTETAITLPKGAAFIPYGAYSGHIALESISIPEGITEIDARAFAECLNLREVILPEGLTHIHEEAFAACRNLRKINFPASLRTIAGGAFKGCSELETAVLNEGLELLGPCAFQYCTALREVVLPYTLRYRTELVFNGCPRIPSNIDWSIEHIVERNDPDFEEDYDEDDDYDDYEIESPDDNTVVIDLSTILPDGQTIITPELIAPFACYVPKDGQDPSVKIRLIIPEGVTEIAADTFRCMSSVLHEVILPESLRHIGESAFEGVDLHEIKLPEGLLTMGRRAFAHAISCFNLEIPASLAVIPEEAFSNSWIRILTLSEGVRIISANAFAGCNRLNQVDLPASLERIEADAFCNCSWLTDVHPPIDLRTFVGKAVIGNCTEERFALTVPSNKISPAAFSGCERLMLCLPDGSLISGYAYSAQAEKK